MKKPILALIPSAYKTSKVYSILPVNGDGDFSFSRNSNATRVQENGLIENKTNNVPRLDWLNSNCPSLLLEPQRTNLALYSENFEGTNWNAGSTIITQNDSIAPSGEKTAVKLQRTSTGSSYRTHFIYKSNSVITYTTSVFVKQGEDNYFAMRVQRPFNPSRVDIRFRFDTGLIYYAQAFSDFTLIDYNVENYPKGWYRIYFTYTSDTSTTLSLNFSPRETDGDIDSSDTSSTSFAYVWGVQTEVGYYLTSYIKTEGSTVTRSEDYNVKTTLSGQTQFDKNKGVIIIDVKPFKQDPNAYNVENFDISLKDSLATGLTFSFEPNNILNFWINDASSPPIVDYDYSYSGGRIKAAILWLDGRYRLFANGQLLNSYNTSRVFSQLDRLEFNAGFNSFKFAGNVYGVQVFDELLSDAEIKKMTEL